MRKRVGVDAGGTFTDVVSPDGSIAKVPSTPDDPARAVLAALGSDDPVEELAHGTTLPFQVLVQGTRCRVALYLSEGQSELLESSGPGQALAALVPADLRVEVPGRMSARGREIEAVGVVSAPPSGVDIAAVALLHADANAEHEQAVAAHLRQLGLEVTVSSDFATGSEPIERALATVVNAALLGRCRPALERLSGAAERVVVMTSAGGLAALEEAAIRPATLVHSSPGGGLLAAASAAKAAGFPDAIALDMGGTSADVCLIVAGQPAVSSSHLVAGLPLSVPGFDVHTIGAGGGSIVGADASGVATVRPESAGSTPGPACYGRGGTEPTVTDADLVAGRIPAGTELPGIGALDRAAAAEALGKGAVSAEAALAAVQARMAEAVRRVAQDRGMDLAAVALVAYGGAGPLHACDLADAVGIDNVVIPARAGVLSAVGLLVGERQFVVLQKWNDPVDYRSAEFGLASLAWVARSALGPEGVNASVEQLYDCRYAGHNEVLSTRSVPSFHAEYERRFGRAYPDLPVHIVALRATARQRSPVSLAQLPDPEGRDGEVIGPASIAEADTTVWVAKGWQARVGGGGAWLLRRTAKE